MVLQIKDAKQFALLGSFAAVGGMLVTSRSMFLNATEERETERAYEMMDGAIERATELARELPAEQLVAEAAQFAALSSRVAAATSDVVTVDFASIARDKGLEVTPELLAFADEVVKRVLGGVEVEE
jgi:hypothetical protein